MFYGAKVLMRHIPYHIYMCVWVYVYVYIRYENASSKTPLIQNLKNRALSINLYSIGELASVKQTSFIVYFWHCKILNILNLVKSMKINGRSQRFFAISRNLNFWIRRVSITYPHIDILMQINYQLENKFLWSFI